MLAYFFYMEKYTAEVYENAYFCGPLQSHDLHH